MWRRVVKECGLEGVTFHSMRHSWASWHVQGKTPLKVLQEMGGWASLEMPMRYAHLDPGHLAQYAETSVIGAAPSKNVTRWKFP
jgi:integrase